jgi:hypothetical protein
LKTPAVFSWSQFPLKNKKPDRPFSQGNPAIPLEKLFAGPEAFRLPITRDLALSRDKRKNPQKEYSGSPEGAIFEFFKKSLA